jgi:MoxR-like ATPase
MATSSYDPIVPGAFVDTPHGKGTVRKVSSTHPSAQVDVSGQLYDINIVDLRTIASPSGATLAMGKPSVPPGTIISLTTPATTYPAHFGKGLISSITEEEEPMKKTIIRKGSTVEITSDPDGDYVDDGFTMGKAYKVTDTDIEDGVVELQDDDGNLTWVDRAHVDKIDLTKNKDTHEPKGKKPLPKRKIEEHEIVGQDYNQDILDVAIKRDLPVLLVGETGTGKTSLVREQAIKRKADWVRFNLTGETTVDEFVGKYELEGGKTIWRDGILLQAMKKGKWLIVDEINVALPEILFVLHSLLDDDKFVVVASHSGEVVKPHKDFRFFATMNPVDEYAGTKELNKAFQSRFNVILQVNYPDSTTESRIVKDKTGVTAELANKMADVAVAIRKAKKEEKVFYTCSTRDLLHWGSLSNDLDVHDAFIVSVLNKTAHDKEVVSKIYQDIFGRYVKLEDQSYTMSIEWFETHAKKLVEERKQLDNDKDEIRKQVTKQIVDELTKKPHSSAKEVAKKLDISKDSGTVTGVFKS